MYKNTVDFPIGNFNYFVEEVQVSPKVVKLLITATHDNGKVYRRDPVYGVGKDAMCALANAYTRLITKTVITNDTQLKFVSQITELLCNVKQIIAEEEESA